MSWRIHHGDALAVLKTMPEESVHCVVTSPPYWGLRSYLPDEHPDKALELGTERTPEEYVQELIAIFREARRVLRPDGTCWINLGDSYAGSGRGTVLADSESPGWLISKSKRRARGAGRWGGGAPRVPDGLKPKDLIGIPWMVAFALRADGWWLRSDIIWCLSGGAWVYARTQKGEMPVMVKDLVRLDPSTVKLWNGHSWTRVLGWGRSNNESERLDLVLRSGERIGCTGGHLWPTQRGNIAARDLVRGDVIQSCLLPEPEGARCPEYLTPEMLWLIGLYLAEGSRSEDTIQLSLHADEMRWLPKIERVARHYGGGVAHTLDGEQLHVRLYGRVLNAIIDNYIAPGGAETKHLKVAAWALPNESLRELAVGYFDGDGHADPQNDRIQLGLCRNYSLERDLRTLAARLGATLTLKPSVATNQHGTYPSFRGEWRWTRSGHRNERPRAEVVEVRASRARKFWDLAVEDEPHLFSLASGILTHNCKTNPMPESVLDRPTRSHEFIFLLTKSERYFYDSDAIREPHTALGRPPGNKSRMFLDRDPQHHTGEKRRPGQESSFHVNGRNKRDVWTLATQPTPEAHFATYPIELIEPCILAGCPTDGVVLDPFAGAGTTALAALKHGRRFIGIELNTDYIKIAEERLAKKMPLLAGVTA